MHPELSTIFYVLGYGAGFTAFWWLARRRGIATDGILLLMGAGLIGGLAGANLVQYMATGIPGKTVLGGIACGYLSVVLAKRLLGIARPTGDLFALGISAGEAIGRWGCFFGGCCYGKPIVSHLPWAVYADGAWRHPAQAYDSLVNAAIFLILLRLLKRNPPENLLFYLQGALYCCGRFVIEFYRDSPIYSFSLTLAQWACLGGTAYFAMRLLLLHRPLRDSILHERRNTVS